MNKRLQKKKKDKRVSTFIAFKEAEMDHACWRLHVRYRATLSDVLHAIG